MTTNKSRFISLITLAGLMYSLAAGQFGNLLLGGAVQNPKGGALSTR